MTPPANHDNAAVRYEVIYFFDGTKPTDDYITLDPTDNPLEYVKARPVVFWCYYRFRRLSDGAIFRVEPGVSETICGMVTDYPPRLVPADPAPEGEPEVQTDSSDIASMEIDPPAQQKAQWRELGPKDIRTLGDVYFQRLTASIVPIEPRYGEPYGDIALLNSYLRPIPQREGTDATEKPVAFAIFAMWDNNAKYHLYFDQWCKREKAEWDRNALQAECDALAGQLSETIREHNLVEEERCRLQSSLAAAEHSAEEWKAIAVARLKEGGEIAKDRAAARAELATCREELRAVALSARVLNIKTATPPQPAQP